MVKVVILLLLFSTSTFAQNQISFPECLQNTKWMLMNPKKNYSIIWEFQNNILIHYQYYKGKLEEVNSQKLIQANYVNSIGFFFYEEVRNPDILTYRRYFTNYNFCRPR
ncbi:MAG: hypothetical protein ACRCWI_03195 [Brevinema sp.]